MGLASYLINQCRRLACAQTLMFYVLKRIELDCYLVRLDWQQRKIQLSLSPKLNSEPARRLEIGPYLEQFLYESRADSVHVVVSLFD